MLVCNSAVLTVANFILTKYWQIVCVGGGTENRGPDNFSEKQNFTVQLMKRLKSSSLSEERADNFTSGKKAKEMSE